MGATSFVNVTSVSRSAAAAAAFAVAGNATSPAAASATLTNSNLTEPEMIALCAMGSNSSGTAAPVKQRPSARGGRISRRNRW